MTLSPLMGTAALAWIDGKTNAAEIARRVCAEALSAGWWYYGEATPALVEKFLETQAKDGLISLVALPPDHFQCPSTQYQPWACFFQWPGTQTTPARGGRAQRPGTQT